MRSVTLFSERLGRHGTNIHQCIVALIGMERTTPVIITVGVTTTHSTCYSGKDGQGKSAAYRQLRHANRNQQVNQPTYTNADTGIMGRGVGMGPLVLRQRGRPGMVGRRIQEWDSAIYLQRFLTTGLMQIIRGCSMDHKINSHRKESKRRTTVNHKG